MEVSIVEESKNRIVVKVKGEGHTICNAIRKELWNDEHVKSAAYAIEHPLIGIPQIIVDTDGADPRKTILAAVKRVQKSVDKVKDGAKSLK